MELRYLISAIYSSIAFQFAFYLVCSYVGYSLQTARVCQDKRAEFQKYRITKKGWKLIQYFCNMKKKNEDLIDRIKQTVLSVEPNAKIILYGSHAKGTSRPDSDWDVLILLSYKKITNEIEKNVVDPLYELEFETGEVISPMVYAENEWNTKYSITPFYAVIRREGISL